MYKICVYVPEKHVETVKTALFKAGAGRIGNYDCCCWQSSGTGQYRPLKNSKPTKGTVNIIEQVSEIKIELVCSNNLIEPAIKAIKSSHPYEEPAYHIWKLADF